MTRGGKFREMLIEQLRRTRYARDRTDIAAAAKLLGVDPSALAEARKRYAEQGMRAKYERYRFILSTPKVVLEHWRQLAEAQRIVPALMLRASIQTLLLGGKRPTFTHGFWFYRGEELPLSLPGPQWKKPWPWRIVCSISQGADTALSEIADRLQCTKTALVRGQVCDYLEGRSRRLVLISASQMYNDPKKYLEKWGY